MQRRPQDSRTRGVQAFLPNCGYLLCVFSRSYCQAKFICKFVCRRCERRECFIGLRSPQLKGDSIRHKPTSVLYHLLLAMMGAINECPDVSKLFEQSCLLQSCHHQWGRLLVTKDVLTRWEQIAPRRTMSKACYAGLANTITHCPTEC